MDEDGSALDAAGEFGPSGRPVEHEFEVQNGEIRLLTQHAHIDAWIRARGRRTVRLADVQDGARAVLTLGPLVRIRLRDPSVVPERPLLLTANLGAAKDFVAFDAAGEVELRAPMTGENELSIELGSTRWGDLPWQNQARERARPLKSLVHVPENGEALELEIDVSADYLADAIRQANAE